MLKSEYTKRNRRTKQDVISRMYSHQRGSSKKRGHIMPIYTNAELSEWLLNDWLFDLLYNNWVNCGYIKNMIPSVDRLDDTKGYSFENIQLMTWGENDAKQSADTRSGKLRHKALLNGGHRAVMQFSKRGKFIDEHISTSEASRNTGVTQQNISKVCQKQRKSAGGYVWKYKNATSSNTK